MCYIPIYKITIPTTICIMADIVIKNNPYKFQSLNPLFRSFIILVAIFSRKLQNEVIFFDLF